MLRAVKIKKTDIISLFAECLLTWSFECYKRNRWIDVFIVNRAAEILLYCIGRQERSLNHGCRCYNWYIWACRRYAGADLRKICTYVSLHSLFHHRD